MARHWDCSHRMIAWIVPFMMLGFSIASWAQGPTLTGKTSIPAGEEGRIQVSADELMADEARKLAEFSGNVKAVQGKTVIEADRLQIHYGERVPTDGDKGKGKEKAGEAVRKIVASGRVRIHFEEMDAEGREATYTTHDRILVLEGPDARVTRAGSGTVKGNRITVFRDDGRIRFEGGVEGVFQSGGEGLK